MEPIGTNRIIAKGYVKKINPKKKALKANP